MQSNYQADFGTAAIWQSDLYANVAADQFFANPRLNPELGASSASLGGLGDSLRSGMTSGTAGAGATSVYKMDQSLVGGAGGEFKRKADSTKTREFFDDFGKTAGSSAKQLRSKQLSATLKAKPMAKKGFPNWGKARPKTSGDPSNGQISRSMHGKYAHYPHNVMHGRVPGNDALGWTTEKLGAGGVPLKDLELGDALSPRGKFSRGNVAATARHLTTAGVDDGTEGYTYQELEDPRSKSSKFPYDLNPNPAYRNGF